MSLGKAWLNGALSSDNKKDLAPVKKPGILAALITVAALAILLIPSANQGLRAVLTSWRPNRVEAYESQLLQMAREAEPRGDAKTMAFVAMRTESWKETVSLSNKAVALDPSLTWIFSQQYFGDADMSGAHDWPAKLAAWDPGNGVAYLIQAEIRGAELRHSSNSSMDAPTHDAEWLDAGRKAMESPRFDSYRRRRIQLDRDVIRTKGFDAPDIVAVSVSGFRSGWISLWAPQTYSKTLLGEAKAAGARGDKEAAMCDAWAVAHFGELLRAEGGNEGERLQSIGYLRPAYTILQPLLAAEGRTDEAKLLSQELEAIKPGAPATLWDSSIRIGESGGWWSTAGITMGLTVAVAVLSASALLFAGIWLFAARSTPNLNVGAFYRTACRFGRFSPPTLLVSLAVLAGVYLPAATAIDDYLNRPISNSTIRGLIQTYNAVFYVRHLLQPAQFSPHHEIFWLVVVVTGVLAILTIIGRNILNRTPRQKVATA